MAMNLLELRHRCNRCAGLAVCRYRECYSCCSNRHTFHVPDLMATVAVCYEDSLVSHCMRGRHSCALICSPTGLLAFRDVMHDVDIL